MKYILLITSMLLSTPSFSQDFMFTHQPYFGIDGQWHSMSNSRTTYNNGYVTDPIVNPNPIVPAAPLAPVAANVAVLPAPAAPADANVPVLQVNSPPSNVFPNPSSKTHYGAPALNIYAGIKFNPFWGIESGYSMNISKSYHTYKFVRHSLHTSLMMFMPINSGVELIGGFGYSALHHVVCPISKNWLIHIKERNSLTKLAPRAIAGMHLYAYEKLIIRLSITWEHSKKMRIPGFNFHDSLHYGLGIQHKM